MQDEDNITFKIGDYAVCASVLLISSSIGIYFRFTGGKQKTFKEYMLADRQMCAIPVAFSLMASFMSAITILGVATENYSFGTQFVVINGAYVIATPIICYIYLPVFYRLQIVSVYEYLEARFGKLARLTASCAFSIQMVLYMGIVLYAPALALSAVTGIPLSWSIIVVGLVCTFYSSMGGMKAVLITDVFQSLLMFASVFVVVIKGLFDFGIEEIMQRAIESERLEFFVMSIDPRVRHTFWTQLIGGMFTYLSLYGVNQAQVQRLLSVKSLKKSRSSLWIQFFILMAISFSTSFAGLVLYTQYHSCDPKSSGKIDNNDQLLPFYVVHQLGSITGLSGLFVAGIFSGSLSTVSSSLNSLAAVTVEDYIKPHISWFAAKKDETKTTIAKLLSVFYGGLCILVAFMTQSLGTGVLQASLIIFGAVGGPLLSVFTLGMTCRTVNQKGAVTGLVVGILFNLWIGFGQPKPPIPTKPISVEGCTNSSLLEYYSIDKFPTQGNDSQLFHKEILFNDTNTINVNIEDNYTNPIHELFAISYMWVGPIGFILTFVLAYLISICTGGHPPLDPNLLIEYIWTKEDKIKKFDNLNVDLGNNTPRDEINGDVKEITEENAL